MHPRPEHVGRFARSIESGWLGRVVALDGEFLKMQGVNELTLAIVGGAAGDHLDADDVQWFVPDDVVFLPH